VLHHLPDPLAGLRALRAALAPGGGLGFMVYAPYGRSGVYPLQAAFNKLYGHLPPRARLKHAKKAFAAVPEGHPLRRNPHLGDHKQSDAGFYDLLMHSQDQAFDVAVWMHALSETGWSLASFAQPGLYDLAQLVDVPAGMDATTQMATAEQLRGTLKVHVGYARAVEDTRPDWAAFGDRVPHLHNVPAKPMADAIAAQKIPRLRLGTEQISVSLPAAAAPLIARIDGRKTVNEIIQSTELAPEKALRLWQKIDAAFCPWGVLRYSGIAR
jgi:hypothetical protein